MIERAALRPIAAANRSIDDAPEFRSYPEQVPSMWIICTCGTAGLPVEMDSHDDLLGRRHLPVQQTSFEIMTKVRGWRAVRYRGL